MTAEIIQIRNATLYVGHVLQTLRKLPSESVQCCVTSPPYWGLRSYGTEPQIWGGDPACDHKWGEVVTRNDNASGGPSVKQESNAGSRHVDYSDRIKRSDICHCGAWRGELGSEPTSGMFVEHLVEIFREVRRVLRPDGVCFVNIGDSYNAAGREGHGTRIGQKQGTNRASASGEDSCRSSDITLKPKDLCLVPWRFVIAAQADGWYVRDAICWSKPAPMPECLAPDTQVFIRRNGWVTRTNLGDVSKLANLPEILTPDGWRQIKNLWKTNKPAMEIRASSVERVVCSEDHRFPISSDRRRKKTRLEAASKIRHHGYADYLLYSPIQKHLTPPLTEWAGRELDKSLGYLIGVYAAEGGHDRGFGIKLTIGWIEDEFAQRIISAASSLGLVTTENRDGNAKNILIRDEWIYRAADAFVPGTCKTKSLCIELILNAPEDFRRAILDGYIDGDGSDRDGGGWIATSASRRLRDDIATLASSVGIVTSKGFGERADKRTGTVSRSHSIWTPYVSRRKPKAGTDGTFQIPPRARRLQGRNIEMIDIEVDGGIFLIGDGLITHNSVRDRCTKAWEPIFMLTKSENYFFDAEAVKEPGSDSRPFGDLTRQKDVDGSGDGRGSRFDAWRAPPGATRKLRNVWRIATEPEPAAHFACFPSSLPERCIKAGTSEKGCCASCGAPWERVTERIQLHRERPNELTKRSGEAGTGNHCANGVAGVAVETRGWEPSCDCNAEIAPCVVLDPFAGSGTTLKVAEQLGRRSIGIELNPKYAHEIAVPKIRLALTDRSVKTLKPLDGQKELFAFAEPDA